MPFKIVQTKEQGKNTLTIIPEKWEQNLILHWPKWKVEELVEQETSCPDDSWMTMKCQVKRTGLISKESAQAELASMLEEIKLNPSNTKQFFNELASCTSDNADITQTPQEVVTLKVQNENQSQNTQTISDILELTKVIQQNQQIIFNYIKNTEDKILLKLSHLSAQVNAIAARNVTADDIAQTVTMTFKIISIKEDLDNFEQQLENPKYREDIKNQLTCICGKGKGRGLNNAYALADAMFTRQFMTQCSWGGGSKKEISKLCFKSYTKTVELFFSVIHESDADYTRMDNEKFFKNIMRHSVSRNKQIIQRAATSRRRPRKQSVTPSSPTATKLS